MTTIFLISVLIVSGLALLLFPSWKAYQRRKILHASFPPEFISILEDKIHFYAGLDEAGKEKFQNKIKLFLHNIKISGVKGVLINDSIRLMVASSAIIPVFLFEEWDYINLAEVLIYDGPVVTNQVSDAENEGIILGQVRPLQNKRILLLSKQSLEQGFASINAKGNVGFHEFAHLIDEADGSIDGLPKLLMPEELISPWTKLMYKEIEKIRQNKSDINPYALTNHAEFFAVVCEYFFENPEAFRKKHEDLYIILSKIFKRK